jgi:hypothetical protein
MTWWGLETALREDDHESEGLETALSEDNHESESPTGNAQHVN